VEIAKGDPVRTAAAILAIAVLVLGACIVLDRPLVRGDGLAYFMWLDSAARDWDLDLANQAAKFAGVNTYHVFRYEATGRYVSVFPFGSALLLVPFYWLATLANRLALLHVNDAYFVQHQGATLAFSLFPMIGANLYALATIILAYLTARKWVPHLPAAAAALALFFGTPLWYYATVEPLSAHVEGAFAISLLLYLFARWRARLPEAAATVAENVCPVILSPGGAKNPACADAQMHRPQGARHGINGESRRIQRMAGDVWLWLAAGAAAGLAALVRWQLALFAVPLAAILIVERRWRLLAAFAAGFLPLAAWVPWSWWRMFGSPFVIPAAEQNRAAFLVWPAHLGQVVFSGEKGLFVWAPLTALALVGLWRLTRQDLALGLGLAAAFALQALVNASVYDWWAGWGFGMRRMVELYPVFVLGLAVLLGIWPGRATWQRATTYGLAGLSTAYAVLLLFSHLNFINTVLDRPQGDTALREIHYQLAQSSFHVTGLVIRDHYGPWAWRKPGP
jgi:hypothetical protein